LLKLLNDDAQLGQSEIGQVQCIRASKQPDNKLIDRRTRLKTASGETPILQRYIEGLSVKIISLETDIERVLYRNISFVLYET